MSICAPLLSFFFLLFYGVAWPTLQWHLLVLSSCRHNDFNTTAMDDGSSFGDEEFLKDVISLQIRLIVSWETNSLVVKISQKVSFMIESFFFFLCSPSLSLWFCIR